MRVLELSAIDGGQHDLVGGKAAGLAALIRLGERVPDGFCVTTEAYQGGEVPRAEVLAAYERLGGGPVAVRSSATAEDLPHASFAGQQDTYLGVTGAEELLAAIRSCWDSLHGERAVAYREAAGAAHEDARMAVVVQRMVDAEVAGVLFTANPVTGSRTETVVDAAPGPGTAVVDGTAPADHYVLNGTAVADHGCLSPGRLQELRATGSRLADGLGAPQDVEWAYDGDGTLWLLQSRPITTLFPAPPPSGKAGTRLYVEFGHVQGMLRPATPMGMSTLRSMLAGMLASFGLTVEIVDIGGRLYGDLTDAMRDPSTRQRLVKLMAVDFGPRAQRVVEHLLDDPRFAPRKSARRRGAAALRTGPKAVAGILGALARPAGARATVFDEIERLRREPVADPATAAELLALVEDESSTRTDAIVWPVVSGLVVSAALPPLLKGVASDDEIRTVLGGMPHNVTIEMDLALWEVARRARAYRDRLLTTPPQELAAAHLAGELPDFGLDGFLARYGNRSAAEVDVGVPRWSEDPTPVFTMLANCLRVTDPEQAPDVRFRRAAARAEATLAELDLRARRAHRLRGRVAGFFLRRSRELTGLREAGKFAGLYALRDRRRRLLLIGAGLRAQGLLPQADDVMFLTLPELRTAVEGGADRHTLSGRIADRRAAYDRELRRRTVPVALLSDGTDVETLLPPRAAGDRTLTGMGAAPGKVTGRARVVRDPVHAALEPGEVLVVPTTDPGWTPLFLTAGGLVTETGAVMAHGPTVAREYGIPAVICVPGATERVRTGQVITVDGAAGTVTVEEARDRRSGPDSP
ncbi:PEP/pyruvate-binding domain-containing protein [Streptomyces griseomycini]|uniref:Pyruvate,water dikinase n=1 Tax=Streptomyces griseomycini TaxID=66895 RepID=A0A7W7PTX5_9ACTN|nr:PEP/pyruvate-binding domain-containing protein [Streptomyces griseomycini]MBB4901219.1 pyruvate,water dikinase [Streptomyces griseomycini]GGR23105.1 phosphoenolpyruvate synthase [Streptomyces griseomycini]